jgi:serine/threonine-protein kinase
LHVRHDRWSRVEELFAQALDIATEQRSAFLAAACDDPGIRAEVATLLLAHDAPGPLDVAPSLCAGATMHPSLAQGTRVGGWRIGVLIGRGGMGEVYAASRADGAFEQRAALKLLRYEAAGELQRFHAERRILARLEHPGIARLLDGGVAPDGRPYTVMEYVEGESLVDYCRVRKSSLRERLTLFAQVCTAVAYAHRNLVIHRDLKPANILVDAGGNVKLLDFGIAKLLDSSASTADADLTIAPFTPDYAAPEQLVGEAVTTATDVYALGVVLFELLADTVPLRTRGLPSTQALKVLLDRSAPAPSSIARGNPASPVPATLIAGDLDAIVAKSLRKEPARRYETVVGLSRDIERHLRNEPVAAREGARLYVAGRLLHRFRWATAATVALVLALGAGLAGTLWQARRAETQARTSAAVQTFVGDLFRANTSRQDDPVKARMTTARELLDLGAKKIETSMGDAPAAKLGVLKLLGQLYDDLALDDESVRLRRQAVELARSLHGDDSAEVAGALLELAGSLHYTKSDPAEREKLLTQATAILDRAGDHSSDVRGALLQKLSEHYYGSDPRKALEAAQQAVQLFEAHPASANLAESLFVRGLGEHAVSQDHEAIASLSRAIEVSRAVDGSPNPNLPRYYAYLGQYQYRSQDIAAAEASTRLALQMAIAVNGENHVDTLETEMRLGRLLFDSGKTQEGLALLLSAKNRALAIRGAEDPDHVPVTLMEHGSALVRFGLPETGMIDLAASLANRRTHRPATTYLATALETNAAGAIELGHYDDAIALLDEASRIKTANGIKPRTTRTNYNVGIRLRLALAQHQLETAHSLLDELFVDPAETSAISFSAIDRELAGAEVELATGKPAAAAPLARGVRERIERSGLADWLGLYSLRSDFLEGVALMEQGQAATAAPLLQRALATREKLLAPASPKIAEAQVALARCDLALGDVAQAQALAAAAAAIHAVHKDLGEQYRAPLRALQAALARHRG